MAFTSKDCEILRDLCEETTAGKWEVIPSSGGYEVHTDLRTGQNPILAYGMSEADAKFLVASWAATPRMFREMERKDPSRMAAEMEDLRRRYDTLVNAIKSVDPDEVRFPVCQCCTFEDLFEVCGPCDSCKAPDYSRFEPNEFKFAPAREATA